MKFTGYIILLAHIHVALLYVSILSKNSSAVNVLTLGEDSTGVAFVSLGYLPVLAIATASYLWYRFYKRDLNKQRAFILQVLSLIVIGLMFFKFISSLSALMGV